jgi:ribbon-helix-helix protein, copG family|nr:MAG TPA: antitoxin [Bacteriophage sp.]
MKEKQSNVVSIRLDDETLAKLKADAQKEYRPLAMHIRKILMDYIKEKELLIIAKSESLARF